MVVGFVIWTVVALCMAGIGIWCLRSREAVGFFSGVKPPEVKDVKAYNRKVAILWFVYAALLELFGLPLLFLKQNSAGFLWSLLGIPLITIGLLIVYNRILRRFELKK